MKKCTLLLILIITISCLQKPKNGTTITNEIYLTIPESFFDRKEVMDNITIYVKINDSIEHKVAVADNQTLINSDSIKKIEGFDANLFQYAKTQEAYNLTSKDSSVVNNPALFFNYQSDILNAKEETNHSGFLTYHKNHMVIIEFVNRKDLDSIIEKERTDFLSSIKIN